MKKIIFSITLILYCFYSIAQQQDLSPAGVAISHAHIKNGWMLNYTFMHMEMGENLKGSEKISDDEIYNSYLMAGSSMKMDMRMIMAMYGVSGRFTVMAMTQYLTNSMSMNMYEGNIHVHNHSGTDNSQQNESMNMNTSGFGDSKITGIYKLMSGKNSSLVATVGFNIPTGSSHISGNPLGSISNERYPYVMQTGSGSVDFSPGLTYLVAKNNLSWSTQLITTIRPFENSIGYHYGNEYLLNCWLGIKIKQNISSSLRIEGISNEMMTGSDKTLPISNDPSSDYRNYGGQKLNSYLGINYFINKGILKESKIALEYGIPIYEYYNGIQQSVNGVVVVGMTVSF